MSNPSDASEESDLIRRRLIGLGERSMRKSYYPELREQIEQLERFRGLMQRVADAIFMHDVRSGSFLDVNQAACELVGCDEERLREMIFSDVFGEATEAGLRRLFEADGDGQVEFCAELEFRNGPLSVDASLKLQNFGDKRLAVTVVRDVTERRQAEMTIRASLREKEILLKEIHHRVKNNLQIISSLLSLQSQYVRDPEALEQFAESQNRIVSMALVHEELYRSDDLSHIPIRHYVQSLCNQFLGTGATGRSVRIELDVADVALNINKAIPCGLVINELLADAVRHDPHDESNGPIRVDLALDGDMLRLTVSGNGAIPPGGAPLPGEDSLGMQLATGLTEQLGGSLRLVSDTERRFQVTFPRGN